ncbi:MAG: glutamate--cysteine ligase [Candidatus Margulisiibacteriota bacterium]
MTHSSPWLSKIRHRQDDIIHWILELEKHNPLPIYSSVDIRDSGYKAAVIDTNLFPAGFNNLCHLSLEFGAKVFKEAMLRRVPGAKRVLVVAEEHTRNPWYIENVRSLVGMVSAAGFDCLAATFMDSEFAFCETSESILLDGASGQPFEMFCLKQLLAKHRSGEIHFDAVLLNNDLTAGIPEMLADLEIPMFPSKSAGWHSRLKSTHFTYSNTMLDELAYKLGVDSWFFSCFHASVADVNVNESQDRLRLADEASGLFAKIREKHALHGIDDKPLIFLKSDSGTYGMGVMPIEDPNDILDLNRKARNQLYKGKGSQVIQRFLLQEGIPTLSSVDNAISEPCIYQIDNQFVGGFYRVNSQKSGRENLNSQGMFFKKMCASSTDSHCLKEDCGAPPSESLDGYCILAKIAGIAAAREIRDLETTPPAQ